jgi:AcrR family transcriptional regulator
MKLSEETISISTEEKIKEAARKVFIHKGFSGARTRDIAEEAGINLALLNYYFRSKENLFGIIMLESLQSFVESIKSVINNHETSIEEKIEKIVENYIAMLSIQPDLPVFIINEIRTNPEGLVEKIKLSETFQKSYLLQQIQEGIAQGKYIKIHPTHIILNILSLTIFPFVAKPLVSKVLSVDDSNFMEFMNQRKKLIPEWIMSQLQTK